MLFTTYELRVMRLTSATAYGSTLMPIWA